MGLEVTKPRPVHLRSHGGGNNTMCGKGGVTFSAPITDDSAEATCKSCLKVHGAIVDGFQHRYGGADQ